MNNGFILLHRKFIEWEWFNDNNMVKLYIYLLLKANHKDNVWRGTKIKRGQLITGLDKLNFETKISIQTLRTCLKRLEKTEEINMQVTNKYRIITICKYDSYQGDQQATNKQTNKQLTSNQQTTNKQSTANNNDNNINNENNDNKKQTYIEIQNIFNSVCIDLPKIQKITDTRKKLIDARTKEYDLNTIGIVLRKVAESDFLNGQNKNNWAASFDWVFNPRNFIKILEDNYKNKENGQQVKQADDFRKIMQHIKDDPDLI